MKPLAGPGQLIPNRLLPAATTAGDLALILMLPCIAVLLFRERRTVVAG